MQHLLPNRVVPARGGSSSCPNSPRGRTAVAVDDELIAFGGDGLFSFPRLCDRMLNGKHRFEVMLVVFDLLALDGRPVHRRPYWEGGSFLKRTNSTATTGR
jgi:hypothetical protein